MKLKLRITKNYNAKDYNKPAYIRFAVIDLDISKGYPANFVCMLPKQVNLKAKVQNKFVKKYGDKSKEIAKQLLKKALRSRPDSETTKAIRERLKLLDPQQSNKTKCQNCGKPIRQYKRRFRTYKFCYECHSKRYTKKE